MDNDEEYQREQYEMESYREQCEEQSRENEWLEHCNYCWYIADQWLMGECSFDDAEQYIRNAGDSHGVEHWAQYIVDHTKLSDEV